MTLTGLDLILVGLAAQRLTYFWLVEAILKRPREYLRRKGGRVGYLATCPVCSGFWISVGLMLGYQFLGPVGRLVVWCFAASAASAFMDMGIGYLGRAWPTLARPEVKVGDQ